MSITITPLAPLFGVEITANPPRTHPLVWKRGDGRRSLLHRTTLVGEEAVA